MGVSFVAAGNIVIEKSHDNYGQMGGSALYSAIGAHIWAKDIGVLGNVPINYPRDWIEDLSNAGIDLSGVKRLPVLDNTDAVEDFNAVYPIQPDQIPESYWTIHGCHLSSETYLTQIALAHAFHGKGALVSVELGNYLELLTKEQLGELLGIVDVLQIKVREVERIFPNLDPRDAVRSFADYGPSVICLRNGKNGSWVWERKRKDQWIHTPAYPSKVQGADFHGAGDAYCGGFLVGFIESGDAVLAARYGTVSASLLAEKMDMHKALRFNRYLATIRLETL
jgi:sugar/nucleoside kinase (ribokinase family)